ncbi:hypothetical protein [Brevundimonas sp. DC300-4]|uniref:hypothetical protein n=1 Tax=Brevundimonas sp. DC300-4 TaxID=2804594 RepID=UPI003CF33A92
MMAQTYKRQLSGGSNDTLTVAALAVLAAITVTVAHEAVGHGSVCLAVGGRVTLLTTSLFRCDVPSFLIDLSGPFTSLAVAAVAALAATVTRETRPGLTLYLVLVAAMAGFWEGAYLVQAVLTRHGDLYSVWTGLAGEATVAVRVGGAAVGAAIYLATVVFASRMLAGTLVEPRKAARTAWAAATVATVAAALIYRGGVGENLINTMLEIGAASLPLLLIPRRANGAATARPIRRSVPVIGLAAMAWLGFALTMGLGIVG